MGRFGAGHLIGCLHGCTVTNKGCLNCASILLFQHTNMQWEAWRGGTHTDRHVKLQRTLSAWRVFYRGSDKGLNCLPCLEIVTYFSVNVILVSCGLLIIIMKRTRGTFFFCFYLIYPSNRFMTNMMRPTTHKHVDPASLCRTERRCRKPLMTVTKKSWALRPDHLKIVPPPKRDLRISSVKEMSGLDYVFCSMARNLCGLWGLEQFGKTEI